jgi:hypothetical protein
MPAGPQTPVVPHDSVTAAPVKPGRHCTVQRDPNGRAVQLLVIVAACDVVSVSAGHVIAAKVGMYIA